MHHARIDTKEKTFRSNKVAHYSMAPFSLPIPGSEETLDGMVCRPAAGYTNYYYNEAVAKDKIVLHHTAGNLQGDLGALTKENWHVSVAFVIARDGTIYQLHGSNQWSHHLGPKSLGGNKTQSKQSIGIELSNYGYLDKKGTDLETPYSVDRRKKGKSPDVYCSTKDKDLYTKLEIPFRGKQYYATFTDAQYTQLSKLVRYLCATYNIPIAFLSDKDRYNHTEKVVKFKGIVSHVNYRRDKWDLGLAFDWQRLMDDLGKKREGLSKLEKQLESAQKKYDEAVATFKTAQVLVWSPEGQTKKAQKQLDVATKAVVEAHTALKNIQDQIAEALENQPKKTRSIEQKYASEKEIDKAFPFVKTRSLTDYGEEGPEEVDLSEFYL